MAMFVMDALRAAHSYPPGVDSRGPAPGVLPAARGLASPVERVAMSTLLLLREWWAPVMPTGSP
jgi:hypothetical protein